MEAKVNIELKHMDGWDEKQNLFRKVKKIIEVNLNGKTFE